MWRVSSYYLPGGMYYRIYRIRDASIADSSDNRVYKGPIFYDPIKAEIYAAKLNENEKDKVERTKYHENA